MRYNYKKCYKSKIVIIFFMSLFDAYAAVEGTTYVSNVCCKEQG